MSGLNLLDYMTADEKAAEYGRQAADALTGFQSFVHQEKWIEAMKDLAKVNEALTYAATELVELAIRSGKSQAACARALNVPASALRGARREFGGAS